VVYLIVYGLVFGFPVNFSSITVHEYQLWQAGASHGGKVLGIQTPDRELENRQDNVRKEVMGALEDTKGRAYYFLKAIIELLDEGKWDKAYGGATWIDILAKIRDMKGVYPAPRDIAIVRSYRIYYKTGSRRYPTHTVPREMMDVIKEALEEWRKRIGG